MKSPENGPRYARLAARVLARGAADDASAAPGPPTDRTATVAAIERALRARGRRRLAPWLGWGVAAAAAGVLLWVGWRGLGSGGTAASGGGPHDEPAHAVRLAVAAVEGSGAAIDGRDGARLAARGDQVAAGTSVRVPASGHLVLALDTGTRLRVGAGSSARVTALGATQRFDLESGTMEAEVAKLPIGGRFLIATADAEVEVRGTRFEVAVAPVRSPCAPFVRTQVTVHEGIVAVRFGGGEVRLTAGSVWPACPPLATPTRAIAAPPAIAPARPSHARSASLPTPPTAALAEPLPPDPSTLAEQNDLFAAALAARRRGDMDEAIEWLDRLIARYPGGPLLESARAERGRLLEKRGTREPAE